MTGVEPIAFLAARVLSCGIWTAAGLYKAMHFAQTVEEMTQHGIPAPRLVLPLVLTIELLGSALLIADWHVWAVCLAWIVFIFPASAVYHGRFVTPQRTIDFVQFALFWKNVSILGGLIAVILLDPSRPAWLLRA
jgi:uncharacterized membrane protein YphA (DoxX/SURF4 family)